MICTGVNGAVRKSVNPKTGVNGAVRTVQKGFCGVSGVVRQFFGPLEGLQRVEVIADSMIWLHDINQSTNQLSNSQWVSKDSIAGYGAISITSSKIEATSSSITKYYTLKSNVYAVFANGRRVCLYELVNNFPLTVSWPVTIFVQAGGRYYVGLGGNAKTPTSHGNTTVTVTELKPYLSEVEIGAGGYSSGYTARVSLTFSTITLGGVSYPVTVLTN